MVAEVAGVLVRGQNDVRICLEHIVIQSASDERIVERVQEQGWSFDVRNAVVGRALVDVLVTVLPVAPVTRQIGRNQLVVICIV